MTVRGGELVVPLLRHLDRIRFLATLLLQPSINLCGLSVSLVMPHLKLGNKFILYLLAFAGLRVYLSELPLFFVDWLLSSCSLRYLSPLPVSGVYFWLLSVALISCHHDGSCDCSSSAVLGL